MARKKRRTHDNNSSNKKRSEGPSVSTARPQRSSRAAAEDTSPEWRPGVLVGLFAVFCFVGLILYGPALNGKFIADDGHYVEKNPYVHDLSVDNLIAIWDPTSVVAVLVENYAPVHLLLHALEWQLFGLDVVGYHVVNVLFHALAATMLVLVYRRSGISLAAAMLGASFFFVHPANVESVAWISQLKSSSALVLSLGALLAHPKRPLLGVVLFALALLAKPFSAFALIVVALFGWLRSVPSADAGKRGAAVESARGSLRWPWLLAWLGVVLVFLVIETWAFSHSAGQAPPIYEDLGVRYRTLFSVALRYLIMAVSGLGLSAFHETAPVMSFFDPWLLVSLVVLALLGWRLVDRLRKRSEEAVYWLWAVVCFAPLSGVVPLPYPMADRYLYFILPGLIGAALLAAEQALPALAGRIGGGERLRQVTAAVFAIVGLQLVHFAFASHSRAAIFQSAELLMADAERNYPNGAAANTRSASRAARAGDFAGAVRFLRLAQKRGYNRLDNLLADPAYDRMQSYPPFNEVCEEMAHEWLDRLLGNPEPSQLELRNIAQAYIVLDDLPAALAAIERGIERPGPITEDLLGDAEMLGRQIGLQQRLEAQKEKKRRLRAGVPE